MKDPPKERARLPDQLKDRSKAGSTRTARGRIGRAGSISRLLNALAKTGLTVARPHRRAASLQIDNEKLHQAPPYGGTTGNLRGALQTPSRANPGVDRAPLVRRFQPPRPAAHDGSDILRLWQGQLPDDDVLCVQIFQVSRQRQAIAIMIGRKWPRRLPRADRIELVQTGCVGTNILSACLVQGTLLMSSLKVSEEKFRHRPLRKGSP
jgi:hypothetical protein